MTGSEVFIAIHCRECGERITDAELADATFPRGVQPEGKQSFKIVCLDCDCVRYEKWIKLHEFIEALAEIVGMKAERKIQETMRIAFPAPF